MSEHFTLESLDTLFPFSVIIDQQWRIRAIGRSLKKILPSLQEGQSLLLALQLSPPLNPGDSPADTTNELILLSHPTMSDFRFRGQTVPLTEPKEHFLLSLDPTVFDTKEIGALGLRLNDFRLGDPIFDIALFTQTQKRAKERLEASKVKLEWEGLAWRTIVDTTLQTLKTDDPLDAYQTVIESVCTFLDWDVGHLFTADMNTPAKLTSKDIWFLRDEVKFSNFRRSNTDMELRIGIGLPGRAMEARDVVWIQNVIKNPEYSRQAALPDVPHLTAVAVPIIVDERVTAVLEFYGERPSAHRDSMTQFLRLLNIQMGQVLARQASAIREKAQLAALAQSTKMAALGEIAAGVAHEINNPLHTLSLINEVLKRFGTTGSLTAEMVAEQYGKIDTCIKHMSRIVMQLRDFSRDASHDHPATVPLTAIVRQTLDLCQARILNKRIRLDIPSIPDSILIRCHQSELAQVLLNLLNNAYDAIEQIAEPWISLEIVDRQDSVELSITDSGPRIPTEVAKKLMNPFFTTKPPGKGTGLGLSISRNIINGLGGDLFLDTSCPHTRFTIRLPQAPHEAPKFDIAI